MFNDRIRIKEDLKSELLDHTITVMGWVRTFQEQPVYCLK